MLFGHLDQVLELLEWLSDTAASHDTIRTLVGQALRNAFPQDHIEYNSPLDVILEFFDTLHPLRETLYEFLFELLKSPSFKAEFAFSFARYYPKFVRYLNRQIIEYVNQSTQAVLYLSAGVSEQNSILRLSVQLFSGQSLTYRLCKEASLLSNIMLSIDPVSVLL